MLRNKRYVGCYVYGKTETPGGMPRIIEDELFERVQRILDRNKSAPARTMGREEYLLTTKLFCGYCREMMVGYGGTSKSGRAYHYYNCKNAKKNLCDKKVANKRKIENKVVAECRKLLTDSNIDKIVQSVTAAYEKDYDNSTVKRLKTALREADNAIENLWNALEKGQSVDMILERIEKRKQEKEELEAQIAIEMNRQVIYTAPQIRTFLYSLKNGDINDEENRKGIINVFLRAVYLWDDRFTLVLNGGDKPLTIEDITLDEIEDSNEEYRCSCMVAGAPPTA